MTHDPQFSANARSERGEERSSDVLLPSSSTRGGREVSGLFEVGFDEFPTYHAFNINIIDHIRGGWKPVNCLDHLS